MCGYIPLAPCTDILRQRTRDLEVKRYCITILERIGSFAYTRDTLKSLDEEARREVRYLNSFFIQYYLLPAAKIKSREPATGIKRVQFQDMACPYSKCESQSTVEHYKCMDYSSCPNDICSCAVSLAFV